MSKTELPGARELAPLLDEPAEVHDGIMVLDPHDFRVIAVNAEMLKLLRASPERTVGRTWQELADICLTLGDFQLFKLLAPQRLLEGELKLMSLPTSSSNDNFAELVSFPMLDAQGRVSEIVLVGRDISQKKRFENDLKQRMYELATLNEFSKALQRTTDLNEVLHITLVGVTAQQGLQFNRAFILLVSPITQTLEGKVALGPSDPHEAGLIWSELSQRGWSLGDLLSSYDSERSLAGSNISAQIRRVQLPLNQQGNILIRALKDKKTFSVVAGITHDGWTVNQDLRDILGSDTFAVIPLYTRQKEIGMLLVDNWINKNPISTYQVKLLEIFASHASSAIENSQLYQDLQEKVKALEISRAALEENQQLLLRAERLSTVGQMAATVAHEIRNPLVSIGGFARLVKKQIPEDHPMHEDVEIITSEVLRLEKIVSNILQYSRQQQASMQSTDFHGMIYKTLDALRLEIQERHVVVNIDLGPDIPPIQADPAQLMQVFYNLIMNAIHALNEGGTIAVSTRKEFEYVLIKVRDTGCGIPKENLDKIFTPFFTTKSSGTGLGLAVVAQIVDAHGGRIEVSSEVGMGTEFRVRLPVKGDRPGKD